MASHPFSAGASILEAPPHAHIVERQRIGEGPVLDSWHDTADEAYAQVEFLMLDREVAAWVHPPPSKLRR